MKFREYGPRIDAGVVHEAGLNGPEALIRGCVTLKVDRSVVLFGKDVMDGNQNMTGRREEREMCFGCGLIGRRDGAGRARRGEERRDCRQGRGTDRKEKMDGGVPGVRGYKLHVNVNVNMLCANLRSMSDYVSIRRTTVHLSPGKRL